MLPICTVLGYDVGWIGHLGRLAQSRELRCAPRVFPFPLLLFTDAEDRAYAQLHIDVTLPTPAHAASHFVTSVRLRCCFNLAPSTRLLPSDGEQLMLLSCLAPPPPIGCQHVVGGNPRPHLWSIYSPQFIPSPHTVVTPMASVHP